MRAGDRFELVVERSPADARLGVAHAAEDWGGCFDPGSRRLVLPILAGLRHGRLEGRLAASENGSGTRLVLLVERADYRVHAQALVVLLFGALGGAMLVVLPFVPSLVSLMPLSILLLLLAWFLVVSRVRHQDARDFLRAASSGLPGRPPAAVE